MLFVTLNELVGWDFDKFGSVGFQVLWAYYDADDVLQREQYVHSSNQ